MNKPVFTLCLFICSLSIALAGNVSLLSYPIHQTNSVMEISEKVKGKVTDKSGNPIPYAIIAELVDIHSNNIVQCDSIGCFDISVRNNSAVLVISAIGYIPKELNYEEFNGSETLYVSLEENPEFNINEVEIVAKRQRIVTTPTGLTYNMNDNPLKDTDTFEALKLVPMVTVQDNLISIVGRSSPVIYVNNRKLNLTGESLIAYLKALPAKSIETIDVIRTPDAKYKGANSVLSIKLKNREDEGIKGFINGQIWKTHDFKQTGSVSLDYAKNKWSNVFSIFAGNYRNYKEVEDETFYKKENYTIDRSGIEKAKAHSYEMNFMGIYQFTETNSLGINVFGSLSDENGGLDDVTHYQNTDRLVSTFSNNIKKGKNITANINYQYHAKDGKKYLIADMDYLYNINKQDVVNEMNNVDAQGNILSLYLKEWQKVPQNSSIYSAKVEYGGKFGNGFAYDFGADAYYSAIRTDNEYMDWKNESYMFNQELSSDFDVNELTPTFFFDMSKKWDKVFASFGTRFEYTIYEGKEHRQNSSFKTDFFRVLPQMNVFYQISKKHTIGYYASYSLQRPSFDLLNPFIVRVSPTEYTVGNPYLQPAKNLFGEINYNFNNSHSLYFQYQFTDDMQNVTQRAVEDGMIENKPENIGKLHYIGFGYNTNFNYLKGRGTINLSAMYFWNSMKGNSEVGLLSYKRHSAKANFYNSFLLFPKQNIRFNLGGDYYSKQQTAYALYPHNFSFFTELSTNIKDFSLALYCRGMLFLNDGKLETSRKILITNDFLSTNKYTGGESFQVGLRFSYSFGNKKVKQLQQRDTSNSGVKGRI